MAFFVQTPAKPSLGELLGGGIGKGLETGLGAQLKSRLEREALEAKPITPYQQILGVQRERDLQRQIGTYMGNLLKEEVKFAEISPLEKAKIDKQAYNLVQQGMDLPTAASQSIQDFMSRKEFLETVELPKPSRFRKEASKSKVIEALQANEITDPFDVQMLMSRQGWKGKDIQDVYRQIRTGRPKEAVRVEPERKETKIKFDPNNPEHVTRARDALKKAKGDRAKANKILAREFML